LRPRWRRLSSRRCGARWHPHGAAAPAGYGWMLFS